MRNIIDFINESYNKNYVFKRKKNKDGSDTTWWAIVKYLAKNGPSTKKEIWDGLGWRYNPATFRGQDSTEIAAMRSAGLITYNTGTRKWSTDIDINNVKPEKVDKLEKDETSKNAKNSLKYYEDLEKRGYKFKWSMMRWPKYKSGSAREFWNFVQDVFYAPVRVDNASKVVTCTAASEADLGC